MELNRPYINFKTWNVDDPERKLRFNFRFCWYGFNIEFQPANPFTKTNLLIQFGRPSLYIDRSGFDFFIDRSDV